MQSMVHVPSARRQTAATASTVPAASGWSLTLITSSRRYLLLHYYYNGQRARATVTVTANGQTSAVPYRKALVPTSEP